MSSTPATRVPAAEPDPRHGVHFSGLLPARMLSHRRPRFWQELILIIVGYLLYSEGRNAVPEHKLSALRHARSVQKLQEQAHLNFELTLNRFVARTEWLAQIMNYYYATLHFVITIGVMIWLFRCHPRIYRGARTVIFVTTLLALAGFFLYPLAPPRLMPAHYGYVDTLLKFHTWGSLADPSIASHSNQYAAMPSLHIAWSMWCGAALFFCARRVWIRSLGLVYPIGTLLVIVGTANHFVIDAIGGLLVFLVGVLIQYVFSGHSAFTQAPEPAHSAGS